ncbi:MAG TPA: hypothetical protein VFD58_28855 [Blastocatellia bacterium]|nr:hypothetical protein [Blastocatellia bacterium]
MPENISVVPVTAVSCQPFQLEVMVFSPEAGFKFQVTVERSCLKPTDTEPAREVWKLVFDLFRQKPNSSDFDQIVHVSYTGTNDLQQKKIASTAANGVNQQQSKQLITRVHPAIKDVTNISTLPPAEAEKRKGKVKNEMSKTVDLAF